MGDGEWVWVDSAYPVRHSNHHNFFSTNPLPGQINTWIVAPYKKPEQDLEDNEVFNNHLSMVRIRSEHAIGFLKGRFHSLKNLPVSINSKTGHMIVTYWVVACIGLHSFAMDCEARGRAQEDEDTMTDFEDPFIAEGMSSASDESDGDIGGVRLQASGGRASSSRLQAGKACREKLKNRLFNAKRRRAEAANARRRHDVLEGSDMDV